MYSGLFAIGLALFCAILLKYFERTQIAAFDSSLYNFTVDISATLEMDFLGRLYVVNRPPGDVDKAFPFHLRATLFEIRDTRGQSLLVSNGLAGRHLPFDARLVPVLEKERAVFRSVDQMRLITYWAYRPEWREPLILQIAVPLDLAMRERRDLEIFVLTGIPLFILIVALAGVVLSKRALKPVHDMTQKARGITGVDKLRERIPVPPARDEIAELAETFNDLLNRLEGAFASQDRFVANASHQLRTPLTILKGELELLRRAPGQTDEVEAGLSSAAVEIDRLIHLVQDLLMLARLDGGRDSITLSRVRPDEILMKVVSRMQRPARVKDVALQLSVTAERADEELGVEVNGDEDLLESLFENFVDNAVKYSPSGTAVEVRMHTRADAVDVEVRDHGPGIPPATRAKVFERFTRGQPSAQEPGSGLGLAIAGEIARLHGVEIELDDAAGGGTRVGLTLKRALT